MMLARAAFGRTLGLPALLTLMVGCGSAPPAGLYPSPTPSTAATPPPPVASTTPATTPAAAEAPVVWAPFTSVECGFTLPMPGTPKTSIESLDTPSGKQIIHSATSDLGDRAAIASCSDLPLASTTEAALDNARDSAVSTLHGTLIASRDVTVGGFPGRDAVVALDDKRIALRLVLAKQRLFTLVALGFSAEATQHFIEGLTLAATP